MAEQIFEDPNIRPSLIQASIVTIFSVCLFELQYFKVIRQLRAALYNFDKKNSQYLSVFFIGAFWKLFVSSF